MSEETFFTSSRAEIHTHLQFPLRNESTLVCKVCLKKPSLLYACILSCVSQSQCNARLFSAGTSCWFFFTICKYRVYIPYLLSGYIGNKNYETNLLDVLLWNKPRSGILKQRKNRSFWYWDESLACWLLTQFEFWMNTKPKIRKKFCLIWSIIYFAISF